MDDKKKKASGGPSKALVKKKMDDYKHSGGTKLSKKVNRG